MNWYQLKHTAVISVSNHPDTQTQTVTAALNIRPFMLSRWKKPLKDGDLENNDHEARSSDELLKAKDEIKKLERKLKRVRDENAVLKNLRRYYCGTGFNFSWICGNNLDKRQRKCV